jgi:hypothetical protein
MALEGKGVKGGRVFISETESTPTGREEEGGVPWPDRRGDPPRIVSYPGKSSRARLLSFEIFELRAKAARRGQKFCSAPSRRKRIPVHQRRVHIRGLRPPSDGLSTNMFVDHAHPLRLTCFWHPEAVPFAADRTVGVQEMCMDRVQPSNYGPHDSGCGAAAPRAESRTQDTTSPPRFV